MFLTNTFTNSNDERACLSSLSTPPPVSFSLQDFDDFDAFEKKVCDC